MVPPRRPARRRAGACRPRPDGARRTRHGQEPQQGRAWLEAAAAKGEPAASYNLALLLLTTDTAADIARAAALLRVAAEAELADAQHALGVLHLRGHGVPRDSAAAARWLRKAADNGNPAGEVEYAILLFNGEGVAADEGVAARYFRRAAAKGNAIAQNRLARLYAAGRGLPQNLVEAGAWHLSPSRKAAPMHGSILRCAPCRTTTARRRNASRPSAPGGRERLTAGRARDLPLSPLAGGGAIRVSE